MRCSPPYYTFAVCYAGTTGVSADYALSQVLFLLCCWVVEVCLRDAGTCSVSEKRNCFSLTYSALYSRGTSANSYDLLMLKE